MNPVIERQRGDLASSPDPNSSEQAPAASTMSVQCREGCGTTAAPSSGRICVIGNRSVRAWPELARVGVMRRTLLAGHEPSGVERTSVKMQRRPVSRLRAAAPLKNERPKTRGVLGLVFRVTLQKLDQWAGPDLNRRPQHFQCRALPTELPTRRIDSKGNAFSAMVKIVRALPMGSAPGLAAADLPVPPNSRRKDRESRVHQHRCFRHVHGAGIRLRYPQHEVPTRGH